MKRVLILKCPQCGGDVFITEKRYISNDEAAYCCDCHLRFTGTDADRVVDFDTAKELEGFHKVHALKCEECGTLELVTEDKLSHTDIECYQCGTMMDINDSIEDITVLVTEDLDNLDFADREAEIIYHPKAQAMLARLEEEEDEDYD
ncbi:MAG: hypothetical protein PHR90_06740 [Sphaerochaetaceae bacterium]|nr:hypothetical protein [Sphaerochaetaceae bacterium]